MNNVFFGAPPFVATCDCGLPSSTSFSALVFNLCFLTIATMVQTSIWEETSQALKSTFEMSMQWLFLKITSLYVCMLCVDIRLQSDNGSNLLARWIADHLDHHYGSWNGYQGTLHVQRHMDTKIRRVARSFHGTL